MSSSARPARPFILVCASNPLLPRSNGSGVRVVDSGFCSSAPVTAPAHQIAEALLESFPRGTVEAFSAGSHPKPLHPNAVRVMRARGVDISDRRPKHLDKFTRPAL